MWSREAPAALHKDSAHLSLRHSPKVAWIQKAWSVSSKTHTDGPFRRCRSHPGRSQRSQAGKQLVPPHFHPPCRLQLNATSSQNWPPQSVPRQSSSSQTVCSHLALLRNLKLWFWAPFTGIDSQAVEDVNNQQGCILHLSSLSPSSPLGLCSTSPPP